MAILRLDIGVFILSVVRNMEWIKKNRDWLITLAAFSCFALLLLFYSLFKEDSKEAPRIEEEAVFVLPKENQAHNAESGQKAITSTSFFLHPQPAELLEKLESLSQQELRKEMKSLPGLKIMWPAYFFSVLKIENKKAEISLDAAENGFGVMLQTEIDLAQYPEILNIARGTKIWLAAEIIGVDPTGTGTFLLATEYVRFDDYQPPPRRIAKQ